MNLYTNIYILIALILLICVVCRPKMDLFSVAAVCFIVYSIYCIPGYGHSGAYSQRLSPQLYGFIYIQLFIILAACLLSTRKQKKALKPSAMRLPDRYSEKSVNNDATTIAFYLYTIVMAAFALLNIIKIGFSGFTAGKANVWENTNVLFVISLYGAYPSFAYGLHTKNKLIWIPSLLIELTIFLSGSRAFATTMAVILLCEKSAQWRAEGRSSRKLYIIGAVAVVFLLVYRMVDQQIMSGDFQGAFQQLSKGEVWLEALEFNEPRVIIANYDYVIANDFRLPFGDTIYRVLDFIPGLTSVIPIKLQISEYFSTWLRETLQAVRGVGGSFWGESYAMLGAAGVPLFTILWLLVLGICNRHYSFHKSYSSFVVSLGTYLSWYINRLDFNLVGQACKVMLFCFLIWGVIYLIVGGRLEVFGRRIRLSEKELVIGLRNK